MKVDSALHVGKNTKNNNNDFGYAFKCFKSIMPTSFMYYNRTRDEDHNNYNGRRFFCCVCVFFFFLSELH